jgi:hypothetical protein
VTLPADVERETSDIADVIRPRLKLAGLIADYIPFIAYD